MKTPQKIMKFYNSKEWKRTVNYVKQLYRGVCKVCGRRGQEVHHIIPLTLENLNESEIRIGIKNLELLCKSCHMKQRSENRVIRGDLMFDSDGNVVKKTKYPPTLKNHKWGSH